MKFESKQKKVITHEFSSNNGKESYITFIWEQSNLIKSQKKLKVFYKLKVAD